ALKALPIMVLAIIQVVAVTSDGLAANLSVSPHPRRAHHARAWLGRDYDGTSILLRGARAALIRSYAGTLITRGRLEAYVCQRARPPRYLKGHRFRPA